MPDDQQFYVSQKAFIENEKGELLTCFDPLLGMDFPGGKIQKGEKDLVASLKREVKEETGLEIEIGKPFFVWLYKNEEPKHVNFGMLILTIGYKCSAKDLTVTLSDEHSEFKWIEKEDIDGLFAAGEGYKKAAIKYFMDD